MISRAVPEKEEERVTVELVRVSPCPKEYAVPPSLPQVRIPLEVSSAVQSAKLESRSLKEEFLKTAAPCTEREPELRSLSCAWSWRPEEVPMISRAVPEKE